MGIAVLSVVIQLVIIGKAQPFVDGVVMPEKAGFSGTVTNRVFISNQHITDQIKEPVFSNIEPLLCSNTAVNVQTVVFSSRAYHKALWELCLDRMWFWKNVWWYSRWFNEVSDRFKDRWRLSMIFDMHPYIKINSHIFDTFNAQHPGEVTFKFNGNENVGSFSSSEMNGLSIQNPSLKDTNKGEYASEHFNPRIGYRFALALVYLSIGLFLFSISMNIDSSRGRVIGFVLEGFGVVVITFGVAEWFFVFFPWPWR